MNFKVNTVDTENHTPRSKAEVEKEAGVKQCAGPLPCTATNLYSGFLHSQTYKIYFFGNMATQV